MARLLTCSVDLVRERGEEWGIARVLARDSRGRPSRVVYPKALLRAYLAGQPPPNGLAGASVRVAGSRSPEMGLFTEASPHECRNQRRRADVSGEAIAPPGNARPRDRRHDIAWAPVSGAMIESVDDDRTHIAGYPAPGLP